MTDQEGRICPQAKKEPCHHKVLIWGLGTSFFPFGGRVGRVLE